MIRDLLDSIDDMWDVVGMILSMGAVTLVLWMITLRARTAVQRARSRCHICREVAEIRFHSRHGQICDGCQQMLWRRTMGTPARDT